MLFLLALLPLFLNAQQRLGELDGLSLYSYSLDGKTFIPCSQYQLQWGNYRGDRYGIYCFNNKSESGSMDVDYCHYEMEGE